MNFELEPVAVPEVRIYHLGASWCTFNTGCGSAVVQLRSDFLTSTCVPRTVRMRRTHPRGASRVVARRGLGSGGQRDRDQFQFIYLNFNPHDDS